MKKLIMVLMALCLVGCANLTEVVKAMDDNNSVVHARYRSTGLTIIGADPATASGARVNIGTMHVEMDRVGRDDYEKIKIETKEGSEVGTDASAGIKASTLIETTGVESHVLESETEETNNP